MGDNWYIGGNKQRVIELNYSCFNFNQNVGELEIFELSPNFFYFSISKENYIKGRTKNIFWNSKWQSDEGGWLKRYKRQKMNYKIARLKASEEFKSYPEEQFITPNQTNYTFYSLGDKNILDSLDSGATKEFLEINEN